MSDIAKRREKLLKEYHSLTTEEEKLEFRTKHRDDKRLISILKLGDVLVEEIPKFLSS